MSRHEAYKEPQWCMVKSAGRRSSASNFLDASLEFEFLGGRGSRTNLVEKKTVSRRSMLTPESNIPYMLIHSKDEPTFSCSFKRQGKEHLGQYCSPK